MYTKLSRNNVIMYSLMNNLFSDWLISEMKKRDWSQSDLARVSGITRGGISNLINQVRKPDLETIKAIAKAFDLDFVSVLRATGIVDPLPEESERIERLAHLLSMLGEDDLQDIEDLAKAKIERKKRDDENKKQPSRSKRPARSALKDK